MNLYYGFSREDTSNLPALKLFARDYRFFVIKDCSHHLFYGFYCFVCVTKKSELPINECSDNEYASCIKLSHIVYIVGFAGGGGGQFLGGVADYAVPDAFVVAFNSP